MADVFISYKAERKNAAEHLRHILEAHGFSVWYDYQLKTGTDFDLQIMRELNAAKAVVVLWDNLSAQSPWVKLEAMTARYNDTYVPVMIEDCVLATEFAKGQYEDLRHWNAEPAAFRPEGLIETLEEKLGRDANVNRTALKQHHREWRKYGSQNLAQFALTATPDKREAEKQPPADIEAAAKAASRMGEVLPSSVTGDASAEFKLIENSLQADEYRLFLSHVSDGPLAFRAARQLSQLEDWQDTDQTNAAAIGKFIARHDKGKALFPALRNAARTAQKSAERSQKLAKVPEKENSESSTTSISHPYRWLGLLVSLVMIIGLGSFFVFRPGSDGPTSRIGDNVAEDHASEGANNKIVGRDEIPPTNPTAPPNGGISTRPTPEQTPSKTPPIRTGTSSAPAPASLSYSTIEKQITEVRFRNALTGHEDDVTSVAFSPDGKTVLTGSYDDTARLWSVETGQTLHTLTGHRGPIWSVAFSPDGRTVLTRSQDKTARLWSVETGETIHTLTGHEGYVTSVAFSPDGRTVLTGSSDNTARLWSVETGESLHTLTGHQGDITSVAFSPDGKTVLTGSYDDTARLWSVETGQTLHTLKSHEDMVTSVAFSPDGRTVLTGSLDNTARIWSVETGETLHTLTGHRGPIWSVAFSPDGRTVLTRSQDKTARLWSVETGETIHTLTGHEEWVLSVAFSPDGRSVLTGSSDKTARLWSVETEETLHTLKGHKYGVTSVAFSPDGKTVLTGSDDKTARLWDVIYE